MNIDARFAVLKFDYDRDRAFAEAEALMPRMEKTNYAPGSVGVELPFDVGRGEWHSISLNYVPEDEMTKHGRGSARNRNVSENWVWRDDIDAPYLRQLVESLPIGRLLCVRLIALRPGNAGSVHNDDYAGLYYPTGARSVTLNLSSGGGDLQIWHNDQHYTVSDYPAFIFRDDCWHGVSTVRSNRIQMRVNAFFNVELSGLIDKDRVLQ
jgi:hypothetical protein